MRLDKFLSHAGYGTRKQVKGLIQQGEIQVNDLTVRDSGFKVDPLKDSVMHLGSKVYYQRYYYVMMNKPQGIISATEDHFHDTVIDWVHLDYGHVDLFPVGRLDIDTTGLLLLTNDGQLAHQLLSPKKRVPKRYEAIIDGIVSEADQLKFLKGLNLGDFTTLPAKLEIQSVNEEVGQSHIYVEIMEGKFHQVKRMFQAVSKEVISLHRLTMGPLLLDSSLAIGEYRELTQQEHGLLTPYGIQE